MTRKPTRLRGTTRSPVTPNAGAAAAQPNRALLRELDVHREELATQNDDLRRANAALSAVKERYAQLYDAAPVAYFTVDELGTIIEANLAGAELFDATRNFLFGRKFDELVVPSSRASFREFRQRVLEHGGRPIHDTVLSMSKRRFPVRIAAARLGGGASPANECLLCVTDESERRRLEDERRELEARVAEAQRTESLGVLAGGIAHDFNNIFAVALGSADLALLDGDDSAAAHEAIREIRNAVRRAADLSAQMLAYTGRGRRRSEPLDLSVVVRSMSGLLASSAPKGALVLDLADDLPVVVGESSQIQQIVLNLVVNAAEAISPQTGRIVLRTRGEPTHAAEAGSSAGSVVLEVADDGRGMDEATQRRAFDPFFSTKFAGRGLGLAVVHGNVRAHGGTVAIDSHVHAGTTFRVCLPASASGSARNSEPANDLLYEAAWRGSGLILVVDDEDAVRSVLGRLLQRIGFDVCYARDGIEALDIARCPPAALAAVVLDLTMPRLAGEATLVRLKALDHALPVIVTSGFSSTAAENLTARADGFVPKPFTFESVLQAMQRALPKRRNLAVRV